MILKLTFFAWILGLLITSPALAQQDSSAATTATPCDSVRHSSIVVPTADPAADDFTPMLGTLALLALGIAVFGAGVGIVLAILALLVVAVLFGVGVTTSAVVVGLWRRSWATGLRTWVWLLATGGGTLVGAVLFAGINTIVGITFTQDALIAGGICGIIAGGVAAFTWLRLIKLAIFNCQRRVPTAPSNQAADILL